ncbi:MAG: hypothetical protein RLP15_13140 [Cryomorphaceae bacterium]
MKAITTLFSFLMLCTTLYGQTMFIDYSERTSENTAAIHIMEARQTIETEEFNDIIEAKTKLIRIIENYRTAGYEVKATSVSTHEHTKRFHYHYQYILQQPAIPDHGGSASQKEPFQKRMKRKGEEETDGPDSDNATKAGATELSPAKPVEKKKVDY